MRSLLLPLAALTALTLTGCGDPGELWSNSATTGTPIHGTLYGGQQPIVGAQIYFFAVNTTGSAYVGATPSTANASLSLLNANVLSNNTGFSGQDASNRYYVVTKADGSFNITGDYTCTAGQQLYIYAVGGNPGAGTNTAAGLMAAVGDCAGISASTFILVNEVSTVAAAYAFAGFAADATHISTSSTTLAKTAVANASANAARLATGGAANAAISGTNITAPQQLVNTIANILAACVNSPNSLSTSCNTLLGAATSTGAVGGTTPTDTATAAINIAHFPGANLPNLFPLQATQQVFGPALTSQPNDLAVALTLTGAGIATPSAIAIDASGNAWMTSTSNNTLNAFNANGTAMSTSSGFTGTGVTSPIGLAIDSTGAVWVADNATTANSIAKFSSTGAFVNTYTGGGMSQPSAIAIDKNGNLWVSNSKNVATLSAFTSAGTPISATGYTGGGLSASYTIAVDATSSNVWLANYGTTISEFGITSSSATANGSSPFTGGGLVLPRSIAVDASGNLWLADYATSAISKFNSAGTAISSSSGYNAGGLATPQSIAVDGAGNVWVANNISPGDISVFNSAGTAISGSAGYTAAGTITSATPALAIDASGDVWITGGTQIYELIGAATPVATPIVANLVTPYTHPASLP